MSRRKIMIIAAVVIVVLGALVAIYIISNGSSNQKSPASAAEEVPPVSGDAEIQDIQVTRSKLNNSYVDVTVFVKNESKVEKSVTVQLSLENDSKELKVYSATIENIEPGKTYSTTILDIKDFSVEDNPRAKAQIVAEL